MLVRFIAKNIYSFKEETEFNLLTSSKTKALPHHKTRQAGVDLLHFGAIYGANGAGKSNLISAINLLQSIVKSGKVLEEFELMKFKLPEDTKEKPTSLAIEFILNNEIYYYTISFHKGVVLYEALSNAKQVFERETTDDKTSIKITEGYQKPQEDNLLIKVIEEKFIGKDTLALSFLGDKFSKEFPTISDCYKWVTDSLALISSVSDFDIAMLTRFLVDHTGIKSFTSNFIKTLNLGIKDLHLKSISFDDFFKDDKDIEERRVRYKSKIKESYLNFVRLEGHPRIIIVEENNNLVLKSLFIEHQNSNEYSASFRLDEESDGTVKLIQYILPIFGLLNMGVTFIIDEIENSLHPKLIKELLYLLSQNKNIMGQLIFTTHESNLLDTELLRPDEIWFVEKDKEGMSNFYPLSDYKVHHTINIEKGYLEGRFGAIPFLGNLNLLNWEEENEE